MPDCTLTPAASQSPAPCIHTPAPHPPRECGPRLPRTRGTTPSCTPLHPAREWRALNWGSWNSSRFPAAAAAAAAAGKRSSGNLSLDSTALKWKTSATATDGSCTRASSAASGTDRWPAELRPGWRPGWAGRRTAGWCAGGRGWRWCSEPGTLAARRVGMAGNSCTVPGGRWCGVDVPARWRLPGAWWRFRGWEVEEEEQNGAVAPPPPSPPPHPHSPRGRPTMLCASLRHAFVAHCDGAVAAVQLLESCPGGVGCRSRLLHSLEVCPRRRYVAHWARSSTTHQTRAHVHQKRSLLGGVACAWSRRGHRRGRSTQALHAVGVVEAQGARVAQRLCHGLASPPPSTSRSHPAALAVWHCWTESKKELHLVEEVFIWNGHIFGPLWHCWIESIKEVTHSRRGLHFTFFVLCGTVGQNLRKSHKYSKGPLFQMDTFFVPCLLFFLLLSYYAYSK